MKTTMKRVLALTMALAMCMMGVTGGVAFGTEAAPPTLEESNTTEFVFAEPNGKHTDVTAVMPGSYTLTFPASLGLTNSVGTTVPNAEISITGSGIVLPEGKQLAVYADGSGANGAFQVKSSDTNVIPFAITSAESQTVVPHGAGGSRVPVAIFSHGLVSVKKVAKANIDSGWNGTQLKGDYSGTLTFKLALINTSA